MSENIVVFPKGKKNTAPQSLEEIRESVDNVRREHIDSLIEEFMSYITSRCCEEGFDFTLEHTFKSTLFLLESVRSAIYNTKNMPHDFQALAENVITDTMDVKEILDKNLNPDDEECEQ